MWRTFFLYTRRQQRGLLCLIFLIVLISVLPFLWEYSNEQSQEQEDEELEAEYKNFQASLKKKEEKQHITRQKRIPLPDKLQTITPFYFDPNTVDSTELLQLGFSSWMASNVLRYRRKQGYFHHAEDFRKIYGLTDEHFCKLQPYIRIATTQKKMQKDTILRHNLLPVAKYKSMKYEAGTIVDLNRADTTELKMIPGIGSVTARRIVSLRQRLGGFYCVDQLNELEMDVERFRPWFSVDTTQLRPLKINNLTVRQLMLHPYLNFFQAKAIVEHRKKNGRLRTLKELVLYEEFTSSDFKRLSPYVSFE